MLIRQATGDERPRIWPFWHRVAAAESCAWDPAASEEDAGALWMAPGRRVYVAENGTGAVVGPAYVTPVPLGSVGGCGGRGPCVSPSAGWAYGPAAHTGRR